MRAALDEAGKDGLMPQRFGKAPKLPEYSKSHLFFADGVQADPAQPQMGEAFMFLNATPYARKIERGQSKQVPDGVYESIAVMAQRRFGNIASISFSYRSLQDGAIVSNPGKYELRRRYGARQAHIRIKREQNTR